MNDALCKIQENKDDLFFPERGASTRKAKVLCRMCPSIEECLSYSINFHQEFGVWGGLSELNRKILYTNIQSGRLR